jgi:HAD superfamily hydrolase (TIGR01509 family)
MQTPPPRPPAALLLDLDGTLVDTEPLHFESANVVLARHGQPLTVEDFLPYVGWSELPFWEDLKSRQELAPPAAVLLRERSEVFLELLHAASIDPLPGIPELLDWAEAQGIPAAVASSSPRVQIEASLGAAGLLTRMRAWRSGHDDVDAGRGKPAPDVYLLAARDLGIDAQGAVALEDSPTGSAAARAAGAYVFGVPCPSHPAAALPDAHEVVVDAHQVLARLQGTD